MKVYLIVDLPDGEDINECVVDMFIHDLNVRGIAKYNDVSLRPLPEKKETCSSIDYASGKAMIDEYENEFNLGFNTCLDEITGETDE